MKKITMLICVVLFGSFLFAQEKKPISYLGIGADFPVLWEFADKGDSDYTAIGFNLNTAYITKQNVGFIFNLSLNFPQTIHSKIGGTTYTLTSSDYKVWMNDEMSFGVLYYFLHTDRFYVGAGPIIAGTIYIVNDKNNTASMYGVSMGMGFNLNGLFRINDKIGITGGLIGLYNFATFGTMKTAISTQSLTGKLTQFELNPYIGLAISLPSEPRR